MIGIQSTRRYRATIYCTPWRKIAQLNLARGIKFTTDLRNIAYIWRAAERAGRIFP